MVSNYTDTNQCEGTTSPKNGRRKRTFLNLITPLTPIVFRCGANGVENSAGEIRFIAMLVRRAAHM
ncbi:MAG: hypothetical protein ACI9R3_003008 [Verrucomicrobiales bacterium]|jgi:hypothetical protein